jgi:hypothetical protein
MKGIDRYRARWTLAVGLDQRSPAVVFREGDHIPGVVSFDFDGDSIATRWLLVNPDKMNALNGVRA